MQGEELPTYEAGLRNSNIVAQVHNINQNEDSPLSQNQLYRQKQCLKIDGSIFIPSQ